MLTIIVSCSGELVKKCSPSRYRADAFSEFNIDATLGDPEVTFNLIGDDGKVIYSIKLTRSQLTPKGP